mmetsp:Transcript_95/g.189  ORF Transcript_95/g.189 Transcript_95/m.189 type:complete len:477 (+) Transcript_95:139-1569(+)
MIVGKFEQILVVLLAAIPAHSFVVRSPLAVSYESRNIRTPTTSLTSTRTDVAAENGGGAASLIRSEDTKSQLASAFLELGENDQYDAVLTGLCAKILDETSTADGDAKLISSLQDPFRLLEEMNTRRVGASPRSIMALVDASAKAQDAKIMAEALSLSLRNGGLSEYGTLQAELRPLPPSPSSRVRCPDGSMKTREQRLDSLPDIPTDDRAKEISSALAASGVVATCAACNVLGLEDITPYTNVLVTGILGVGFIDNCYDLLKGTVNLIKGQVKNNDAISKMEMPDKGSLPLGLGTGKLSGTVARGLSRLLSVDTERECECEAAAFFAAYSLGLPSFAFRPNSLEAAVLVIESTQQQSKKNNRNEYTLDTLLSNVGMLKMLVWLMAPVAMEASKHPQLIVSDPREASGLLKRLEDKAALIDDDIFWADETDDLLKWAYAEANVLLQSNKAVVKELTERLAGGAATVGDCVAVLEKW